MPITMPSHLPLEIWTIILAQVCPLLRTSQAEVGPILTRYPLSLSSDQRVIQWMSYAIGGQHLYDEVLRENKQYRVRMMADAVYDIRLSQVDGMFLGDTYDVTFPNYIIHMNMERLGRNFYSAALIESIRDNWMRLNPPHLCVLDRWMKMVERMIFYEATAVTCALELGMEVCTNPPTYDEVEDKIVHVKFKDTGLDEEFGYRMVHGFMTTLDHNACGRWNDYLRTQDGRRSGWLSYKMKDDVPVVRA